MSDYYYEFQGIPTVYRKVRFRSRLEARWAAFFDQLFWPWKYEADELPGWIPDFRLDFSPYGGAVVLVEIKPAETIEDLHAFRLQNEHKFSQPPGRELLILGAQPLFEDCGLPTFGLLNEGTEGLGFEPAYWHCCDWCDDDDGPCGAAFNFHHSLGSYYSRVCGHHDGDHHLGAVNRPMLWDRWIEAGNRSQWAPNALRELQREEIKEAIERGDWDSLDEFVQRERRKRR